jgi:hypothetical protein
MDVMGLVHRFAVAGAVAATLVYAGAASATPLRHATKHKVGRGTSSNWSGYSVDGSGATHVIGTWTEPAVTCAPGENSWSSPWVGIDGDNSTTVEQIGTDSDCVNGTPDYYAWYEMYPKNAVNLSMPINPGDSITGEVTYSAGSFVLKLIDTTTNTTFKTTQTSRKALRTSVEWIMEGPSSGLLSDFGTVAFSGAAATINGTSGALGTFTGAQPITMVRKSGVVRAAPSAISGGSAFNVAWQHA